ncbi:hypothetical protein FKM82_026583 [Ascaphus truei]
MACPIHKENSPPNKVFPQAYTVRAQTPQACDPIREYIQETFWQRVIGKVHIACSYFMYTRAQKKGVTHSSGPPCSISLRLRKLASSSSFSLGKALGLSLIVPPPSGGD